jgi:hypothetical protein
MARAGTRRAAMKAAGAMLSIAILATVTGCSQLAPYATYPRQPDPKAHDAGPRVAVCYDGLVSSGGAVQRVAQAQCTPNTVAKRIDTDWLLQYCPLLVPARATFVCTPKQSKK